VPIINTAHARQRLVAVAEREDGYIGRILEATRKAGIFEQTTFFIVSDHGFMAIDKKFEPNVLLAKENLLRDAAQKSNGGKLLRGQRVVRAPSSCLIPKTKKLPQRWRMSSNKWLHARAVRSCECLTGLS
jgi:predicted AlkP superfamily pyrophosphatase or phosphodiesterase